MARGAMRAAAQNWVPDSGGATAGHGAWMEPLDRVQSTRGYGRSSFASAIPGVLPSRIHVDMNGLWQLLGSLWIVHEARREPGPDLIDRQADGRVWI